MSRNSDAQRPAIPVELSPERRMAAAAERYGERPVVLGALSLLAGYDEGDDFLLYVGGAHAQGIIDGAPVLYWPELWGARALLHVWDEETIDDNAKALIMSTLQNTAWRVREMGTRLVAARGFDAADELAALFTDEVARVRGAAATALGQIGTAEDMDRIRTLLKDPAIDVRRAAQRSLDALRKRLPRD